MKKLFRSSRNRKKNEKKAKEASNDKDNTMLRLVANITENNEAQLTLETTENPMNGDLKPDEVVIKMEACPVNPSDLILLAPPGTDTEAVSNATKTDTQLTYPLDKTVAKLLAKRVNNPTGTGNEGGGVVVKAGIAPEAQALMGKVVSVSASRQMYAQFVKMQASKVLPQLEGTTAEEAASGFVNPVTVACIVDTVKTEGHKAFIHTAAASQLGIMLNKLCLKEELPLINIVRKESQEKTLRDLGAKLVVRSDQPTFMEDLIKLCAETEATCAFDAIGGGDMVNNLLMAMEEGAKMNNPVDPASFYGTPIFKQVYIYGALNSTPTVLNRGFGFCWGINAWLVPNYLAKLKPEKVGEIMGLVAANIKTIFKTEYYKKISLKEMLDVENFLEMRKQETGKKFLILPQK